MYFLSAAPANFAGELGSSTRKTVQWTVFIGIMRESEGFPVWPKGPNCHGSNQNLRRGTVAAVLCGISSTISPACFPYYTISQSEGGRKGKIISNCKTEDQNADTEAFNVRRSPRVKRIGGI